MGFDDATSVGPDGPISVTAFGQIEIHTEITGGRGVCGDERPV